MSVPEGYKALGKIGISYKGDYNSNTAYERLDAVYHNGSTYLAIKDAPDGAPRDDKINWIYLAKGYDGETVDVAEAEVAFEEAETRENIVSGEKVSTIFGKIKKFFADLTAPAFAQMITTKEDLLATKVTGYVPDAKAVADGFADVNGKLSNSCDATENISGLTFTATKSGIIVYNLQTTAAQYSGASFYVNDKMIQGIGVTTANVGISNFGNYRVYPGDKCEIKLNVAGGGGGFQYFHPL